MAISYFPLTINVSQIVGTAVKRARLQIATNLPAGVPLAYGDEIAVPGGIYSLAGGVGEVDLPTQTGVTNLDGDTLQYIVTGEYSVDGAVKLLDPIYIDAPTTTAPVNLASFIGVTSVPPTFMGAAVAQLQAKVDEGSAEADRAEAAASAAVDISGIEVDDDIVEALIKNTGGAGPKSVAALNAAIGDIAMLPKTATRLPDALLPTASPSTTSLVWESTGQPVWPLSIAPDGSLFGAYRPEHKIWRTDDRGTTFTWSTHIFTGYTGAMRWAGRVAEGYGVLTGGSAGGEFWFSTGINGTWTKTKDFGPIGDLSRPNPVWTPNGTVLIVGEYVNNISPSTALKSWGSFDGGQTWKLLRNTLVNDTAVNSHWHAAHYDAKRRRIWLSGGDGPNAWFGYSDDHGLSWVPNPTPFSDPLSNGIDAYQQPTALIVYEDRLILGPDRGPAKAGIVIGDAETGYSEQRYALPGNIAAHLQYGMGSPRPAREMYLALSDQGGSASRLTYIVGTGDGGITWHLLSTIDCNPGGSAQDWLVGPDRHGYLYIKMTTHPTFGSMMIRAKAPTWTWARD